MSIVAHMVCHLFEVEADWQIRIVQNEGLAEIKRSVDLTGFIRQNKIDVALKNFFKLCLLDGRAGGIIIENDLDLLEGNSQSVINFERTDRGTQGSHLGCHH